MKGVLTTRSTLISQRIVSSHSCFQSKTRYIGRGTLCKVPRFEFTSQLCAADVTTLCFGTQGQSVRSKRSNCPSALQQGQYDGPIGPTRVPKKGRAQKPVPGRTSSAAEKSRRRRRRRSGGRHHTHYVGRDSTRLVLRRPLQRFLFKSSRYVSTCFKI
jgi:hypothetical protein